MDGIVEAEAQPLHLFIVTQPQFHPRGMVDRFREIVLKGGEDAPHRRHQQDQQSRHHQGGTGGICVASGKKLRLVNRTPQQARDHQLHAGRDQRGQHRKGHLPWRQKGDPRHAPQRT